MKCLRKRRSGLFLTGLIWLGFFGVEVDGQVRIRFLTSIGVEGIETPPAFVYSIRFYDAMGQPFYSTVVERGEENGVVEIPASVTFPSRFYIGIETDRTLPLFTRILTPATELELGKEDFLGASVDANRLLLIPGDVAKGDKIPEINAMDYYFVSRKWGQSCQCPEDLNWDGKVDDQDLELVARGNDQLKSSLIPQP